MVFALPLVQTRERTLLNPFSIISITLFLFVLYLFFGGEAAWPKFLKNLPEFAVYLGMIVLCMNGIFAFLQPSLIKPEAIGCMEINDEFQIIIINQYGQRLEITFEEINKIEFEIKGSKNFTGNFYGNMNFISITYNYNASKFHTEFVLETNEQMHSIKNAINKIVKRNPQLDLQYLSLK